MSDQTKQSPFDLVKRYLVFIDTNVLFKKPVSCLFAIASLCIPVYFLLQAIHFEIFKSESARLIIACLLLLVVLIFAGIFGFLIWWHRRLIRDEGPKMYNNFRRFIQTLGEWAATLFAIVVFFGVLIIIIFAGDEYYMLTSILPIPAIGPTIAVFGLVGGFLIIIATKILLFLLDPLIWLIKQIWILIKRMVLYFYRCVVKVSGTVEQHTPIWLGITWLLSVFVVLSGIALCFRAFNSASVISAVFAMALGLGYMGFLVIKRKNLNLNHDSDHDQNA